VTAPAGERLAELSRIATLRAAALTSRVAPQELGVVGLASILYRFGGCIPASDMDVAWPQLLLRRAEGAVNRDLTGYVRSETPGWMSWTRPEADVGKLVHKVYVSPAVPNLAEALPTIFAVAIALGIQAWKVGADVPGLHRPDKVVLYLLTAAEADASGTALDAALNGLAPQGVPFTGQLGESGIVSRGLDRDGTSWRALVCRALAEALWQARDERGGDAAPQEVAEDACAALAASGYDVAHWMPRSGEAGR